MWWRSFQNKSFSSLTTHHGFLVVDIKFPLWFTRVMSTFLIPVMWFNLQPVRNWPGVSPTCSHQSSSQTHPIDGPVPSAAVCYSVSDTNARSTWNLCHFADFLRWVALRCWWYGVKPVTLTWPEPLVISPTDDLIYTQLTVDYWTGKIWLVVSFYIVPSVSITIINPCDAFFTGAPRWSSG